MKFIAIIPARYASTRFPGKPLAMLGGKPIIQRVCEQARAVFDRVLVATDDTRIAECVDNFGGKAVMTRPDHRSGTDRCFEAYEKAGEDCDVVVNVQGDEPFIAPQQLKAVCHCFDNPATDIATLVMPFAPTATWDEIANPNSPKVVVGAGGRALYFSRSVIPYIRGSEHAEWPRRHTFFKHIGLYAYRSEVLKRLTALPPSPLEMAESLEQLRWLEAGYTITTAETHTATIGIDTPADLERATQFLTDHP